MNTPEKLIERLDEVFNNRDIDGILNCYVDDAIMAIKPGVEVKGKEKIKEAYLEVFDKNPFSKQEVMYSIIKDDVALFLAKWVLISDNENKEKVKRDSIATSIMYKQKNGTWKLAIDNSLGPAVLLV